MPVDFSGLPVDYHAVMELAKEHQKIFVANSEAQKRLGRILVVSDAAHSFGALCNNKPVGGEVDVAAFSFHAVKFHYR